MSILSKVFKNHVFGDIPRKPKGTTEQIDQLWDAVYNHIASYLRIQDFKMNFLIILVGLILAFMGALVAVLCAIIL